MLAITETAVEAIKGVVATQELPESAGVRIVADRASEPEGALEVSVAATPAEDDEVIEEAGAQVFLEPRAAEILEDKVLDAEVDQQGQVSFAVGEQG